MASGQFHVTSGKNSAGQASAYRTGSVLTVRAQRELLLGAGQLHKALYFSLIPVIWIFFSLLLGELPQPTSVTRKPHLDRKITVLPWEGKGHDTVLYFK
jgi:hypothetical protein